MKIIYSQIQELNKPQEKQQQQNTPRCIIIKRLKAVIKTQS